MYNSVLQKRVFVVDDEHDVILTIQIMLEENGYIADRYDKPKQALKCFKPRVRYCNS
jgi:FixJ family two-component response regulator